MDTSEVKNQLRKIGLSEKNIGSSTFDKLARKAADEGVKAIMDSSDARKAFGYKSGDLDKAVRSNPNLYYKLKH